MTQKRSQFECRVFHFLTKYCRNKDSHSVQQNWLELLALLELNVRIHALPLYSLDTLASVLRRKISEHEFPYSSEDGKRDTFYSHQIVIKNCSVKGTMTKLSDSYDMPRPKANLSRVETYIQLLGTKTLLLFP